MMYEFNIKGGWREIEDFLETPETSNYDEERVLAGFGSLPALTIGDTDSDSFALRVFVRSSSKTQKGSMYKYLADLVIGGEINTIAIDALPDLLEFMRQNVPLVATVDDNFFKRQDYLSSIESAN